MSKWSKESLAAEIVAASERGEPLYWAAVCRSETMKKVATSCIYHFGSWSEALRFAGFKPDEVSPNERWGRERVLAELLGRDVGGSWIPTVLAADAPKLYGAILRHFGTVSQAVAATGLDAGEAARRVSPDNCDLSVRPRLAALAFCSPEALRSICRVMTDTGCWEWPGPKHAGGYFRVGRLYGHRLSYMRFKGKVAEGEVVRHECDNPPCVNPDHLVVGSQADNVRDREERGRTNYGHRFTSAELSMIRETAVTGVDVARIAKQLGVSAGCVYGVKSGRTYKGVG